MNFRKIHIVILLFIITFGCNNIDSMSKKENQKYIIKKANSKPRIDSLTGKPIQFIREFYFDYNIILIDTLSSSYFHKKRFYCLTSNDIWNNSLPIFRNLKPEYFEKAETVEMVLKRILENDEKVESVYLISNKDTISDTRYFKLKQDLTENGINVSTRVITEEERVIITSILEKRKYNPDEINWEKTLNVYTAIEDSIDIVDDIKIDYDIE